MDAPAQRPRERVLLLVDDDEPTCRYAARVLANAGFRVVAARDGEEAKELLATLGPVVWLVVSDVQMPRMGGEELADLVAERWPKLPVLLTSGQGHPPEGHTGPFLPKPYAPGALVSAVRALLPPSGCPACR
jgi:DNA-binding NtrC family response regulator